MEEKINFHKVLGAIFVLLGLIFYPTPVPGTTLLLILGLVFLFGKKRTLRLLKEHLNKKIFKSLKIKSIMKKL